MLKNLVVQYIKQPKKLFLIDGLGAVLSAFLLGVVLVKLEPYFGIPINTLYTLAILPIFFLFIDCFAYLYTQASPRLFLKIIGLLNMAYCALSLGLAVYHMEVLTTLAWTYISIEIIVVSIIAFVELAVANGLKSEASKHAR